MKGINTSRGGSWKVEASPPSPPQEARYGSLRCLHSLGRVDHCMVPFLSLRLAMKGHFGRLTLPALARESGPLHGPFPLAPFGNPNFQSLCIDYSQLSLWYSLQGFYDTPAVAHRVIMDHLLFVQHHQSDFGVVEFLLQDLM